MLKSREVSRRLKTHTSLIDRIADRLANLDGDIEESVTVKSKDIVEARSETRSRGPFGRKSRLRK